MKKWAIIRTDLVQGDPERKVEGGFYSRENAEEQAELWRQDFPTFPFQVVNDGEVGTL